MNERDYDVTCERTDGRKPQWTARYCLVLPFSFIIFFFALRRPTTNTQLDSLKTRPPVVFIHLLLSSLLLRRFRARANLYANYGGGGEVETSEKKHRRRPLPDAQRFQPPFWYHGVIINVKQRCHYCTVVFKRKTYTHSPIPTSNYRRRGGRVYPGEQIFLISDGISSKTTKRIRFVFARRYFTMGIGLTVVSVLISYTVYTINHTALQWSTTTPCASCLLLKRIENVQIAG